MKTTRNIRIREWATNQIHAALIRPYEYKLQLNEINSIN